MSSLVIIKGGEGVGGNWEEKLKNEEKAKKAALMGGKKDSKDVGLDKKELEKRKGMLRFVL